MIPALHIANAAGVPGTAGALVRDAAGMSYLLSNHHVVFGSGGKSGGPIWAIPPGEVASRPVMVGRALRGELGRIDVRGEVCFVDCALVELSAETPFPSWLQTAIEAAGWFDSIASATPGMRVWKHGVATGLTEGVMADIAYPDCPAIEGRWWKAPRQLLVNSSDPELNFSAAGDSGAMLVDEFDAVLGLLWGINGNGDGIASPIEAVLSCLGVTLASPVADCRLMRLPA